MARSPRGSIVMADIEEATPATRGHKHSTCSAARLARMRSPTGSAPADPPSGPAKRARPPRRATVTAALPAQPPETIIKAEACVFASGRGNLSTRNTASSTAMPVHSTSVLCSVEDNVVLHEGAHDVMGDRDRIGRGEAGRMYASEHQRHLRAIEPARVLELAVVDRDLVRARLGVAADHQRHRERPGLRSEIGDAAADDAGFLAGLTPNRVLDGLARLDEAR